ncbi:hypothetical protein [Desertivirga arenae]|uniref:hypothetical protein n=1 Tax=Desertivirga arenae TaxID=2810309 RepID=UPI001A97CD0E|nr:hypothetical protein [Pedobacter sp. SYSU D00823]
MVVIRKIAKEVLLLTGVILFLVACENHKNYSDLLSEQNTNSNEIKKILNFYYKEKDPDKLRGIEYIMESLKTRYQLRYTITTRKGKRIVLSNPSSDLEIDSLRNIAGNSLIIDTIWLKYIIRAKPLIMHINNAYSCRGKYAWIKNINNLVYYNYILPYQVNNENFTNVQETYRTRFLPFVEDVLSEDFDSIRTLFHYISPSFDRSNYKGDAFLDFTSNCINENLLREGKTYNDLEDIAVLHINALRAIGVPCTYEFTPFLPFAKNGEITISVFNYQGAPADSSNYHNFYRFRVAKFYRNEFNQSKCVNPYRKILDLGVSSNDIPFALNLPNVIDITEKRTECGKFSIPIRGKMLSEKVLYLATGNDNYWKVVTWGKVEKTNKVVEFDKVGYGLMYRLAKFKSGKLFLLEQPFNVDKEGVIVKQ